MIKDTNKKYKEKVLKDLTKYNKENEYLDLATSLIAFCIANDYLEKDISKIINTTDEKDNIAKKIIKQVNIVNQKEKGSLELGIKTKTNGQMGIMKLYEIKYNGNENQEQEIKQPVIINVTGNDIITEIDREDKEGETNDKNIKKQK